jgi:hypothetical protein
MCVGMIREKRLEGTDSLIGASLEMHLLQATIAADQLKVIIMYRNAEESRAVSNEFFAC